MPRPAIDQARQVMDELRGLHITVTRPVAQAESWASQLRMLGADVSVVSLLEIIPVQDKSQIRAIKNCVLDFDSFQKAIFVSQNAVEHGFEWIENYWPQLPVGIDYFAVGETTARQLQARGVAVMDLAQTQTGAMTSETLLQSPALQHVTGEKIVIFRGLGGRPHLGEMLVARGALVSYCALYERKLPSTSFAQFAQLCERWCKPQDESALTVENVVHVVTVHSGEALGNLCEILQASELSCCTTKEKIVLLVPSQRILAQATAAGFNNVYAAQNATDTSMLQGLMELKRNLTKV